MCTGERRREWQKVLASGDRTGQWAAPGEEPILSGQFDCGWEGAFPLS